MSLTKRSGYISKTISTSLENFVLGVALVFTKFFSINLLTPIKPSKKYVHQLVGQINNTDTLVFSGFKSLPVK